MSSAIRTSLFAAVFAFASSAAWAQAVYKMTLSGASPSGFWYPLGIAVDGAVKTSFPGSSITYRTSGGGFANMALLDQGKVELGFALDAEVNMAVAGVKPFSKPMQGLRAIGMVADWTDMHVIVTKAFAEKYGIRSFEDIAAKKPPLRVAFNKRGNVTEHMTVKMLNAIGVDVKDIEKWGGMVVYAASDEATDLIRDKRIDSLINAGFVRSNYFMRAADAGEVVLLPVSDATVKRVTQETGTRPSVIKGGSYAWQSQDVLSITLGTTLVASDKMDEKTAYDLAQALHKNFDKFKAIPPVYKENNATPELLTRQKAIPYHKGAERYYREAGLIK